MTWQVTCYVKMVMTSSECAVCTYSVLARHMSCLWMFTTTATLSPFSLRLTPCFVPMPLGPCCGFVLSLHICVCPFHWFFHVCLQVSCFSYFRGKTPQTINPKPFTQPCVPSSSHLVSFLPFIVNFLEQIICDHCVSFHRLHFVRNYIQKGHQFHPAGQTQWPLLSSLPSCTCSPWAMQLDSHPSSSGSPILHRLLGGLPTAGIPPRQTLAFVLLALPPKVLGVHDRFSLKILSLNRSKPHFHCFPDISTRRSYQAASLTSKFCNFA